MPERREKKSLTIPEGLLHDGRVPFTHGSNRGVMLHIFNAVHRTWTKRNDTSAYVILKRYKKKNRLDQIQVYYGPTVLHQIIKNTL